MATSEISCGYGLASSGQREREEDHHHVASRLRTQLHSLVNRLIERCNIGTPISVEPRSPHAPFLTENAAYYNELGAQYFVIETTGATGSEHVPGGLDTDSDAVKLGAVMYDNCVNAALLCWPALRVLFEDDEDISHVEWVRVRVNRPRFVYFYKSQSGNEVPCSHDIIIIYTHNGEKFAFDPTGYQFGFEGYLFSWNEYEADFGVCLYEYPDGEEEEDDATAGLKELRAELEDKTKEEILRGEFWL